MTVQVQSATCDHCGTVAQHPDPARTLIDATNVRVNILHELAGEYQNLSFDVCADCAKADPLIAKLLKLDQRTPQNNV